ncbi:hypothetical protein [Zooshikella sp. RANM57]|uniref:hypothetical protein n=1 Tax=Zooshikella sp. RANM57 TaxID=3425863 RepID=UPI003D6DE768
MTELLATAISATKSKINRLEKKLEALKKQFEEIENTSLKDITQKVDVITKLQVQAELKIQWHDTGIEKLSSKDLKKCKDDISRAKQDRKKLDEYINFDILKAIKAKSQLKSEIRQLNTEFYWLSSHSRLGFLI